MVTESVVIRCAWHFAASALQGSPRYRVAPISGVGQPRVVGSRLQINADFSEGVRSVTEEHMELAQELSLDELSRAILKAQSSSYADHALIVDLCKIAGRPHVASQMIAEGLSVDQARHRILNMLADEDEATVIISHTPFGIR